MLQIHSSLNQKTFYFMNHAPDDKLFIKKNIPKNITHRMLHAKNKNFIESAPDVNYFFFYIF